jgi:hypothetical protein
MPRPHVGAQPSARLRADPPPLDVILSEQRPEKAGASRRIWAGESPGIRRLAVPLKLPPPTQIPHSVASLLVRNDMKKRTAWWRRPLVDTARAHGCAPTVPIPQPDSRHAAARAPSQRETPDSQSQIGCIPVCFLAYLFKNLNIVRSNPGRGLVCRGPIEAAPRR